MAMKFQFKLCPFGYQNDTIELGTLRVHSAGSCHEYTLVFKAKGRWHTIRGTVSKIINAETGERRSGHRNFLHLLRDILNDIDLEELGKDYVNVWDEVQVRYPHIKRSLDYPEESKDG